MNIFEKMRWEVWPVVKVWSIFTWWRIRYGGVKNIPPEKLIERMEKNFERTRENLFDALRVMPDDATAEERDMILEAISEHNEIERIYRDGMKKE